ncbi:unnamed protein product [Sympodiomycopsis kandeliae]
MSEFRRIQRDNSSIDIHPQRESRIHSIYEKYLYDPKDLGSTDPKLRALARKASKEQSHHHNMSGKQQKKRQSSVMFARGTKGEDGRPDASTMPRSSTGSAYDGFGALMDAYSDDESDSDASEDNHRDQRQTDPTQAQAIPQNYPSGSQNTNGRVRESWSARAEAVGQRPPDSASQNPPTLKLLGLKSQREGGAPIGKGGAYSQSRASPNQQTSFQSIAEEGASHQQHEQNHYGGGGPRPNPPQRNIAAEQSVSEYGDNSSRIGSTIDFGGNFGHTSHPGHGSDGFGGALGPASSVRSPSSPNQLPTSMSTNLQIPQQAHAAGGSSQESRRDPRSALTAQLGLDTPQPEAQSPSGGDRSQQGGDYFSPHGASQASNEVPLQRNMSNESASHVGGPRSPEHAMIRPSQNGPTSSHGSPPRDPFTDRAYGRPLISPPRGPVPGGPSSPMSHPAQPSPSMGPQGRSPPGFAGPGRPHPNAHPPHQNAATAQYGGGFEAQPRPRPAHGPGFSDARGPPPEQKRQSIFRRSMAFMTGNAAGPSSGNPHGYQGGGGASGPQLRSGDQGVKRQSIFRRSMALLTGNKPASAAPTAEMDDANCPAPRVRGFDEKEVVNRKSQYWGGGGQGSEWDAGGAGSKFWRRFSAAQKHAATPGDKMEGASRTMRQRIASQQKAAKWSAGVGGILIIAAVVAVVIWREAKSGTEDDNPGSINKGDHGGTDTRMRRSAIETALPGAEIDRYQRLANAVVWDGAKVVEGGDESTKADATRADSIGPAATPAAVNPQSPKQNQSMRRRVRRHANLLHGQQQHGQIRAAEQVSVQQQ